MRTLLRSFRAENEGTALFSTENFSIMFSNRKLTNPKEIKSVKKTHGISLERPPDVYRIKKLGFYIKASYEKVELFRNASKIIELGQHTWIVNVAKPNSKIEVLYSIGLKVSSVHVAKAADFKTQAKIDAAFRWYNEAVANAEQTLKAELKRIYSET